MGVIAQFEETGLVCPIRIIIIARKPTQYPEWIYYTLDIIV